MVLVVSVFGLRVSCKLFCKSFVVGRGSHLQRVHFPWRFVDFVQEVDL